MKWTLNRINYYYKTLHTNLHYFNVSVGQCERQPIKSNDYCKYYQPSMDTLAIESPLACHFFVYSPDQSLYIYIKLMFVKWHSFFKISHLASVSQTL